MGAIAESEFSRYLASIKDSALGSVSDEAAKFFLYKFFSVTLASLTGLSLGFVYEGFRARNKVNIKNISQLASLGNMASSIAYELNSPLTLIQGFTEQIQRAQKRSTLTPEWMHKKADQILDTVDSLHRIISGLLQFSGIHDGAAIQTPEKISAVALIHGSLEFVKERLRNHGIACKIRPIPEVTLCISVIPIKQVLLNLLSNAFEAISMGPSHGLWIEISVELEDHYVLIRMTDGGQGIPEHIALKMMEPMFTTKTNVPGAGLGLSIAKTIVEDHKGFLYFDPTHPNTSFVVKLPVAPHRQ
jgi:C4-dicarboxylate-specific signal transduction histidine kinase